MSDSVDDPIIFPPQTVRFNFGGQELQLEVTYDQPLPQDDPFMSLIGRVAAEFARIEHLLDMTIWTLSGVDAAIGSCITGQLTGQFQRFSALESLATAKGFDQNLLTKIKKLAQRTGEVAKLRNRFVHDAWYAHSPSGEITQFRSFSAKDQRFGLAPIGEQDAIDAILRIREKVMEVKELCREILIAHQASLEKPPLPPVSSRSPRDL
jgi:hypothetical protein